MAKAKSKKKGGKKAKPVVEDPNAAQVVLTNRRVRHDYEILESWEAGLVLQGSEVKSLRNKAVQWADAHARVDKKGELWLYGLHIEEYKEASHGNHEPSRARKLLLHKKELQTIADMLNTKGVTAVPSRILFRRGFAKITLCLVRGKRKEDKRSDMIARERDRDIARELARRYK